MDPCCKCGVWVHCKRIKFVAAGWCTRKWFRLYQIIRKLNFGDLIIPLWWFDRYPNWKRPGSHTPSPPNLFEGKGEKGQCDLVCGVPLDDWADGGYVDVLFTCDECGFSSLGNWSCSEWRVWDLVTKSMFISVKWDVSMVILQEFNIRYNLL